MRLATLAAVSGVALASSAFAGFTFSSERSAVNAQFDRLSFNAVNDGVGTGSNVVAIDFTATASAGTFRVTSAAIDPDDPGAGFLVNLQPVAGPVSATAATTRMHGGFGTLPGAAGNPNPAPTAWGVTAAGSVVSTVSSFSWTLLTLGTGISDARIGMFVVPTGSSVLVTGRIGGSAGSQVPFEVRLGGITPPPNVAPVFAAATASGTDVSVVSSDASAATVAVDFGDLFGSRAFTVTIPLSDDAALVPGGLSVTGSVAGLSGLTSSIVGGNVVLSGTLARTVIGTLEPAGTLTVTYTDAGNLSDSYAVSFNAIPEPATLALVAGAGLLALRRRA